MLPQAYTGLPNSYNIIWSEYMLSIYAHTTNCFPWMYISTELCVSGEGLLWQQAHAPLVRHMHICWLLPQRNGFSCLYLVYDGSHSWVRCTEQLPLGLPTTDIRSIVLYVIINDGIYSIHRLVLICYNIIIMLLTIALTVWHIYT